MKAIIVGTLITALAIGTTPRAEAGDEGWAAFGGVLGGLLLSKTVFSDHGHHRTVRHHREAYRSERATGHYEYRREKRWIPGCWVTVRDDCGRSYREWQPGYYKHFEVKVWVADCNPGYRCARKQVCRH